MAADGDAGPQRRRDAGARGSRRALAAELRAVGITLDYAPVLDIHTNPKNPIIGDRALGGDGRRRSRGSAPPSSAASGRTASRPAASTFPGHGDTSVDSHLELPLVEHPPDRIRRVEFVPFRAAIAAGVAIIMTAHVLVPSLDEQQAGHAVAARSYAACCARSSGFNGVILSDDLEMKAIART